MISYFLQPDQQQRLIDGVRAAIAFPLIDSIEDFIWEGIFCYAKQIPIVDPLNNIRSKKLYDVVDEQNHIGWSAKALQVNRIPCDHFEVVIQRADIISKRVELGFPNLTINSNPSELGAALLAHWHNKIDRDAIAQRVQDKRICILLKSRDYRKFAYIEEAIAQYNLDELEWRWSNESKTGLQAFRKRDGFCVYKWYKSQKQFFECFSLRENPNTCFFNILPQRADIHSAMQTLISIL